MTTTANWDVEQVREVVAKVQQRDDRLSELIAPLVDYVSDKSFFRPGAEDRFFGPDAEEIVVLQWRQYSELEDPGMDAPRPGSQLSPAQEATLFLRYNYARYRLSRLLAAQKQRFSQRRAEQMLPWQKRAMNLRAKLTNANMALVVAMAKRTRINAVEFGELVGEGNMALLRAVDKFDVSRGFKFSTYACRAILKSFNRLATKTGTYRQHFPVEFDTEIERSDQVDRYHSYQLDLAVEDLRRALARNTACLSAVERAVVNERFSIQTDAPPARRPTLEQVGRRVGLSKERVRQVQMSALAKLRVALEDVSA